MKIENIEIINTLSEIHRINEMIAYHRAQAMPSKLSIQNYQVLHLDLVEQLNELLSVYQLTVKAKNRQSKSVQLHPQTLVKVAQ
jgi:hypothetical protein